MGVGAGGRAWGFAANAFTPRSYKPGPDEPSEFDQEAHDHWERLFREADLDPAIHIVNGNKKDNFWMMGDTGPCGPCSELHVDLTPDGDTRGALVNKDDPRCIEIWNLVFIQFNANADGSFTPLPQRHVDTGLGLERSTALIQGTKNFTDFSCPISNYETDVFRPIFDEIEKLSGKKYGSTLPESSVRGAHAPSRAVVGASPTASREAPDATPEAGVLPRTGQMAIDIAFRVVADHIRTITLAIADGIIPSNEGRGYVLRRILRRAVRYGRTLGFHEPFFFKLVDVVTKTMGDVFAEIRTNQSRIQETIKREEEAFNKTLDRGIEAFNKAIADRSRLKQIVDQDNEARGGSAQLIFPSRIAFELYDTYGFPLDLTELMAREQGFTVIATDFEKRMEEQRARARAAQKKETIEIGAEYDSVTEFVGYDLLEVDVQLLGTIGDTAGRQFAILDKSPFYAEMGGQVGDRGEIHVNTGRLLRVGNTAKRGATVYHEIEGEWPVTWVNVGGEPARAIVDADRRRAIERHHTVTHLLHWALHELVSPDARQKGSYVGPDKLTFDFSSTALTKQKVREVEDLVNKKITENAPVSWTEIPYTEAKNKSDIQQFFGDKYGDTVRVVQIGGSAKALDGYSMELCGGTHVRATGEIESFRIVREEAIAAGIRRIEAVAGKAVQDWAREEAARQQEKFETLARKKPGLPPLPAFTNMRKTSGCVKEIDSRSAFLEKLDADVREWEKQQAKSADAELQSRAARIADEVAAQCAGKKGCVAEVPDADGKLLGAVADALKTKFGGPIFLAGTANGRVSLIASVPKEMTTKFQANKIIQETAAIVGGKGGGRPESAQGGGTDSAKIGDALKRAEEILSK